jgi:hypothetical protein
VVIMEVSMDKKVKIFVNGYSGRKLTTEYGMNTEGLWQIYGEDSNCDFGGSHHMPLIDTVRGKLSDVIEYAVSIDRFWTWGGGGDVRKIEEKAVPNVTQRKHTLEKIAEYEERIRILKQSL